MHREEDGAIHFWKIKENLQNQFPQSFHWSDDRWKACLAAGCGEVEDIVSVLTPDCRGVAQVFHDLLVELRLLLVVEVEGEEKEDGQEEGREVEGGSQVEEKTTTWMAMMME